MVYVEFRTQGTSFKNNDIEERGGKCVSHNSSNDGFHQSYYDFNNTAVITDSFGGQSIYKGFVIGRDKDVGDVIKKLGLEDYIIEN